MLLCWKIRFNEILFSIEHNVVKNKPSRNIVRD